MECGTMDGAGRKPPASTVGEALSPGGCFFVVETAWQGWRGREKVDCLLKGKKGGERMKHKAAEPTDVGARPKQRRSPKDAEHLF